MLTINKIIKSKIHLGHKKCFLNPKMSKYIIGCKNKIHIIDIKKTIILYKKALEYISILSANNRTILLVCTKKNTRDIIKSEAKRGGLPYINQRWLGGTFTNYEIINNSIKKFKNMIKKKKKIKLNTKGTSNFIKKFKKLKKFIGGMKMMNNLPDAIFVIDTEFHKNVIKEAKILKIPIIAIVDTNNNPENIDYIIPGNNDSIISIKLYIKNLINTIIYSKKYKIIYNNKININKFNKKIIK
ncbi:30S ribosomal subunit protein S2 [Candidatus Zinderia insecticola CARI]|uniref:Small ribosomal subunit protein uS2 n=1 Tax=Zinderia insecticola (strain CARI) TaxID=871271 RepID=E0TIQ5_ZINIC|nr:30S ribosomal subunit protein S2 [Candidatus Zinderia insecticola CARI]